MRRLSLVCSVVGLALLGLLLWQTDLAEGWTRVTQVGWGATSLLALYVLVLALDSLVWLIGLPQVRLGPRWFLRLLLARLVGEAINSVTPGGFAGEPVKLSLLQRRHGLDLQAGIASIFVARTLNLLGLLPFVALALALAVFQADVARSLALAALTGLLLLSLGVAAFFAIQWLALSSQGAGLLARRFAARRLGTVRAAIRSVESRLIDFYRGHPIRLAAGIAVGFVQFCAGALECWLALYLLGLPVSYGTALMLEGLLQLVRTATFFVPGNLGTQDGAFVLLTRELGLGGPVGLAMALLRRFRELAFILLGFACGLALSLERPRSAFDASADRRGDRGH